VGQTLAVLASSARSEALVQPTYAGQKTTKSTCCIVLSRVELNLASLGSCRGAGLVELAGCSIAEFACFGLCIVGDTPGGIKLRTSELGWCGRRSRCVLLRPGSDEGCEIGECTTKSSQGRERKRHLGRLCHYQQIFMVSDG